MKIVNNQQSCTFRGVRENLVLGHKVLREFNQEFPHLYSSTFYDLKASFTNDKVINAKIQKLKDKKSHYLQELRVEMKLNSWHFDNLEEYIACLKRIMKLYKVGNCGERTNILYERLKNEGKSPVKLHLKIVDKETEEVKRTYFRDHCVILIDDEILSTSSSSQKLGKNAVIIDPWYNMVSKAASGINKLKELFQLDYKREKVLFGIHNVESFPKININNWQSMTRLNLKM